MVVLVTVTVVVDLRVFDAFDAHLPPSGPPSAPRNAISNVNETSVFLEWSVPMELGGRKDVRYNILCRRVLPGGRGLEECGPNVRFLPRRVNLSNTSLMVADLQSHTNYSFLLEAVNGVSEQAKDHSRQYVSLNVTTNQAGTSNPDVTTVDGSWGFYFMTSAAVLSHLFLSHGFTIVYRSTEVLQLLKKNPDRILLCSLTLLQ